MSEPVSCRTVAEALQPLQSGALGASAEAAVRAHLADCAACRRRLEVEDALLTVVRRGLPRTPAPPGLDSRVRAALASAPGRAQTRWFARPAFLVGATAAVVALLLVPLLPGRLGLQDGVPVVEDVLVVDDECDREGRPLDLQRECTHPYHVNALRRRGNERWLVSPEDPTTRRLLLDRGLRGYRVRVEGELLPALRTLRVRRFEVLDLAARRASFPGGRATVSVPAVLHASIRRAMRRPGICDGGLATMSQVKHVADGDFDGEVLQAQGPVLVDFSATWCGPCKRLEPLIEELAADYAGRVKVVKVDVDQAPATAARYGVLSVPTLLLFRGGRVEDQMVGLMPKRALADRIDKVL